jgi:hypothetical protein
MIRAGEPKVVMSMDAVRCIRCGETRWSLFPSTFAQAVEQPCELCGGPTVPERRRPGSGRGVLAAERRTRFVGAATASRRSPARTAVR